MITRTYDTKEEFPNMTCNRIILYGILYMIRESIYRFKISSLTIKTCNQYAINIITKKWKAKKNLDILKKIWFLIDKRNIKVSFIKVKKEELEFQNVINASEICI